MAQTFKPAYKRILLKLSGEALMGRYDYGIDPDMIAGLAAEIVALSSQEVEIAIVIGGGNIFRGEAVDHLVAQFVQRPIDRLNGLARQRRAHAERSFLLENQIGGQHSQR